MAMQMIPVSSSNITAAGHDAGTMRVRFSNGTMYDYAGVSAELFNDMLQSESVGRFYHANIKGKFTGTKVEEEGNGEGN